MPESTQHHRRALFALLFAVFVTVLGVGMAVPLLPLYAHRLGGTGLHIGLLSGAFAFSRLVCAPWFGRHSDSNGRKGWIVTGLVLYAAISFLLAQIHDVTLLVVARALHGIAAAMLMPLVQAYIGDVAPPGREGRLMGAHGAVTLAGLGLGPMLGGLVSDRLGVDPAFLIMGALAASGAVACALCLAPVEHEARARVRNTPASWYALFRHRVIAGLIIFRFAHVVCVGIVWSFLPLYATTSGALSTTAAGMVVGLGVLCGGLLNIPMGALADRANRSRLIMTGGLVAAYGIFSFGRADSLRDFALASACLGAGGGIAIPSVMAIVTQHGQRLGAMGSMMALMTVVHGAGMMTGALLGGLVMDRFALGDVFPAGAVILAGGTLVFALLERTAHARRAEIPSSALPVPLR